MLTFEMYVREALARLRREDGQTMAEYAVILGVIAAVVIVAIAALSGGIGAALDRITDIVTPAP